MWARYGRYLTGMKVFAYVEHEDTPRPLAYQLELMRATGFRDIDVLHKNVCFAAFGARK